MTVLGKVELEPKKKPTKKETLKASEPNEEEAQKQKLL